MANAKILIAGDIFPIDNNQQSFCNGNLKELFGDKICNLFSDADLPRRPGYIGRLQKLRKPSIHIL